MTEEHTHWVPADAITVAGGRFQQAICRRYVDPLRDHALEPTCPICRRLLAEDDEIAASITRQEATERQQRETARR